MSRWSSFPLFTSTSAPMPSRLLARVPLAPRAHPRLEAAVRKEEVVLPGKEGVRLAREVADQDGALPIVTGIRHVDPHARPRHPVAPVGDPGIYPHLGEGTVAVVAEEVVRGQ